LLGQPSRQGGHVAALRLAPVHDGHEAGHRLAALDLLDGSRPRRRRTRRLPPESAQGGERHVKAVVMAGGEGTRLRPLTSNQPKPMVPVVGKPCMEHILELLKQHGFDEVVVTDEDGRIERFLEKPSWGQVFSDTINTGIYVLEPEVLRHIPDDRPHDFSKELFPLLLEMGRPLYGHIFDGYWQDIGNLDQFRP